MKLWSMTHTSLLDRAFAAIIARMVRTGQAPHYVELAAELGVEPETGRTIVHDLMSAGIPGWTHPGTDSIA